MPWWMVWEGLVGEYWDGAWRIVVDNLGGKAGIAVSVPAQSHLLVALDNLLLYTLSEEDELILISSALREILHHHVRNDPGLVAFWRLPLALQNRRSLRHNVPPTFRPKMQP